MTFAAANSDKCINIVLIRSSSIGDVVLATACLNLLAHSGLNYRVHWIGRSPSLNLISAAYSQLIPIDMPQTEAEASRLLGQLGEVHLVCDLQTNMRSFRLAKLLAKQGAIVTRAKKNSLYRAGLVFKARLRGRKWGLKPANPQNKQFEMMLEALSSGLSQLTGNVSKTAHPWLPLPELVKKNRFCLGVAPGASYDTKKAPTQVFVEVLQRLREEMGEDFVIQFFGDQSDEPAVAKIINFLGGKVPYESFAGKLSLAQTAEKLAGCQILLTNDSSLCHIAEAVGTEAAVLFGPTSELFGFTPWRPGSRTFSVPLGCRPCSKHGKTPCRYKDKMCFNRLNTDAIARFLADRLKSDV